MMGFANNICWFYQRTRNLPNSNRGGLYPDYVTGCRTAVNQVAAYDIAQNQGGYEE